jgi:hypothetical protein
MVYLFRKLQPPACRPNRGARYPAQFHTCGLASRRRLWLNYHRLFRIPILLHQVVW